MAEEVLEKTVKQLKRERTTAKSSFTRQANLISKEADSMVEEELREEFNKLSVCLRNIFEANDEYRIGLLAEATKEEVGLGEQLESDIEKTVDEAETKFKEVRGIIQKNLWSRYGQEEVTAAILVAERSAEVAGNLPVQSIHLEGYKVHLSLLEKRMKEVIKAMSKWERWIPGLEKRDLDGRTRDLKEISSRLELRSAEFATARRFAEEASAAQPANVVTGGPIQATPTVRIKPTALPTFSGNKRDYHRWRKDWESLQRQGEPSGSAEVKKIQLLSSVEDEIMRDLRLSNYNTADEIFRVMENRYGNKSTIVIEILEELERMAPVKGNQPRKVIDVIQTVEKALADLTELGNSGAIRNPLVIKTIESKLPDFVKRDWLIFMLEPSNDVTPDNHFDMLLKFLKKQEGVLERLEQLKTVEKTERPDYCSRRKPEKSYASTKMAKKGMVEVCGVCDDWRHHDKLFFCKKFKGLKLQEKKAAVEKLGACKKCLGLHDDSYSCKDTFLCRNKDCNKDGTSDHHYLFCPVGSNKKFSIETSRKSSAGKSKLTDEQERFLSELTPEMAEKCRNAFTNSIARTANTNKEQSELLMRSGLCELPVILMLMEVTANAGQKVGTLVDLASDTNYITHKAADRLRLRSENVTLVLYGVGGMTMKVNTRRYLLKVRIRTPEGKVRAHEMVCYGLDEIAKVHKVIEPERLKEFFPEVEVEELRRPKEIELLISHREGRLAPQRMRVVGDLVLWESPLGKTVGGAHPELFEDVEVAAHGSRTHFARSMRTAAVKYEEILRDTSKAENSLLKKEHQANVKFTTATNSEFLEWWRWESIGAACEPRCGGCRCGNCQPGGKEMTLAEEKELEIIKRGLTYIKEDTHVNSPHWDARYPWIEDPASLPNNRTAVEATFLRTERQLEREPEWKAAYTAQVHEMVERRAAMELTEEMRGNWKGPVWYVSHLVAPNPHSVTTPVRLVWNSSQKFKGVSMNDLLLKGPDVLNPIRAVLLRLRRGVYAAIGDIKKKYNSVWLEEREMHLHRFLWRDKPEEEIKEYAITRVNIGDRPAGCIAQLAMRETARLSIFAHLEEECRILEEDSYVDDILTSHNSREELIKITQGVENILSAGGFFLKPWVWSGQSGRQNQKAAAQSTATIILPNQMRDEDNKALGVGYQVGEDMLYMMTSINFSKRKRKVRLGEHLKKENVRLETPDPLSRRELLSQVAGLYDPIGLVTPVKQRGAILVRKAFQEAGGGKMTRETWDKPLSEGLREEAIKMFEEYVELRRIKFHRSITPAEWRGKPWGITFSDGSDKTYGAVMHLRWDTERGVDVRFVEAKAKLTPLDQKGEATKAEICGAVFAARLRKYFERHGRLEVDKWFHLVDSQTVLGAIQRDSYGYQTFFANRVGEIQRAGPIEDWWWIPGELNIADIMTRGGTARDLEEGSVWQNGPEFLRWPVEEWPKMSAGEVAAHARESVNKLQRKAFIAAVTRSQLRGEQHLPTTQASIKDPKMKETKTNPTIGPEKTPADSQLKGLVEVRKFSNLHKLVNVVAWVQRAAKKWLEIKVDGRGHLKGELAMLTVREREDALRHLLLEAQEGGTFPVTALNRLVVYKDEESGLLLCGGRVQIFTEDKSAVPMIPYEAWTSVLIAREAHNANHEGVAGTLLRMRKKAWVIKCRRLAKKRRD
ncbi:uncharacterized protein ACNS7B_019486 [Menidia menidia]